jgi:hypothetical protein
MKLFQVPLLVIILGVCASACSGNVPHTPASSNNTGSAGFALQLLPDPLLQQECGRLSLRCHVEEANTVVEVSVAGARELRSVYFKLLYDKNIYTPLSAVADGLARCGPALSLNLLDDPGVVYSGQVLQHPQEAMGMNGNGVIAVVTFKPAVSAAGAMALRHASTPPVTDGSRARLSWQPATSELFWYVTNQGDYNQNGTVDIADLTPLGINFGAMGPFANSDVRSCVDGDGDNSIGLSDLAPLGINYGHSTAGGYYAYEALDLALYPSTNSEASLLSAKSQMPFANVSGNPATERLHYHCSIVDPLADAYYWVRPIDNSHQVGTPSTICGGGAATAPFIKVTTGCPGAGTYADPYVIGAGLSDIFQVLDPADGDVTADPATEYYVSPNYEATVDPAAGLFNFAEYTIGKIGIYAIYNNRETEFIWYNIPAPFTWNDAEADSGDPALDAVGKYCSMADVNSMPSIASYDVTAGTLRYTYFSSEPVPAWHASTVDASGVVGRVCSLMELHNLPAICYHDQSNYGLKFALGKTDHPSGPADWTVYMIWPGAYALQTAMCVVNGLPVIIFNDDDTDQMYCLRSTADLPGHAGDWVCHSMIGVSDDAAPSVCSVNGVIAVAYDGDDAHLNYCYSKNASPYSSSDWTFVEVDGAATTGDSLSLCAMDGWRAAIAYYDYPNKDVKFALAHTASPVSAADWDLSYIRQEANKTGKDIRMDIVQGKLCLAYSNDTFESIWFAMNKVPEPDRPQDWQSWEAVPGPGLGEHISMAGLFNPLSAVPGIAYYDASSGNLHAAWPDSF